MSIRLPRLNKEKQKLFGLASINNLEEFLSGGDSKYGIMTIVPLNIMKSVEMWSLLRPDGRSYIPHWIEDWVYSEVMEKLIKKKYSPQVSLAIFEEETKLRDIFGSNNADNYILSEFNSPNDLIEFVRRRLYTETKKGADIKDPKYKSWFIKNPSQISTLEYKKLFKYIALCLSGQLNPEIDSDFSRLTKRINSMSVNYSIIKYTSKNDIFRIIVLCIKNFWNYILPELESEIL